MTFSPRVIGIPINKVSPPRALTQEERDALRKDMKDSSAWMRAELARRRITKPKREIAGSNENRIDK